MKKSGTLEHLRECVEEQMDAITERHRKCFEDVAGGDGTPASKAITAALIHDMMVKELAPLRRTLAELKRMERGS